MEKFGIIIYKVKGLFTVTVCKNYQFAFEGSVT